MAITVIAPLTQLFSGPIRFVLFNKTVRIHTTAAMATEGKLLVRCPLIAELTSAQLFVIALFTLNICESANVFVLL